MTNDLNKYTILNNKTVTAGEIIKANISLSPVSRNGEVIIKIWAKDDALAANRLLKMIDNSTFKFSIPNNEQKITIDSFVKNTYQNSITVKLGFSKPLS